MSKINLGTPWPLGSSITTNGVNFSLAAPIATKLELLLFNDKNEKKPSQIISLDKKHKSGDYWHVEVEGLKEGSIYAYRIFQDVLKSEQNNGPNEILLDPSTWNNYNYGN